MASEGNKLFWRGLGLIVAGMVLNTVGNYVYDNRRKIQTFILNVQKQLPDLRDLKISDILPFIDEEVTPLPPTVDLRPKCPPIWNQGSIGSCSSQAGVAVRMMLSDIKTPLSRLYQYYQERYLEGNVNVDSGATMRSIGKAMQKYGVSEEKYFPYVESTFANEPSDIANVNAETYKISNYYAINTLDEIRQVLQVEQKPVLAAIDVYESFSDTPSNGMMPKNSGKLLGGHALAVVGYSDEGRYLIFRNSYGTGFGDKGYFYMPYDYFNMGYARDFWYLKL